MQVPLEVTFRDVPKTEALEALVQSLAVGLERYCDHIDSCRVAIERPSAHPLTFRELRVRVDLTVPPGHELVVTRESAGADTHDSIEALVREAFHAAKRRVIRLKDLQREHTRPAGRDAAAALAEAGAEEDEEPRAKRRSSTMTTTGLEVFDTTINRTNTWLRELMEELSTDDRHRAYAALRATLHALRDRLTPDAAASLGAQLPMLIRGLYYEGWQPSGKPIKARHKEDFLLMARARIQGSATADWDVEDMVRAVFRVIGRQISEGETEKLRFGLPTEIRELWLPSA